MTRSIIDLPLIYWRSTSTAWQIDWRGQSAGGDAGGGEQIVAGGFPRFVGRAELVLPPDMIGHWRALMMDMQGRANALRVRMVDPALQPQVQGGGWQQDWDAFLAGQYVEPRPQVSATVSAPAGGTTVVIDESGLTQPIRVGQFLSHADWPFVVTGRSGTGGIATLQVRMLRVAIPVGGQIDVIARGQFVIQDETGGQPTYALADQTARPEFDLQEWITR